MAEDEPRIIIDEDWKAQVQREREQDQQPPDATSPDAEEPHPQEEASFSGLVRNLAAQCAFALGLIAPPDAKRVMVDIGEAKYLIDTLVVLRAKTKGNLTEQEEGELTQTLAELQQIYVARAQQVQEAALRQSGIDLKNLKK